MKLVTKIFIITLSCSTLCFTQTSELVVEGNETIGFNRNLLKVLNVNNSNLSYAAMEIRGGTGSNQVYTTLSSIPYSYTQLTDYAGYGMISNINKGLIIRSTDINGDIKFVVGGKTLPTFQKMILDKDGNVGIGVLAPKTKLHVDNGDIYLDDINSGIIMKSPNGDCWRVTIDNGGTMTTTAISCP